MNPYTSASKNTLYFSLLPPVAFCYAFKTAFPGAKDKSTAYPLSGSRKALIYGGLAFPKA